MHPETIWPIEWRTEPPDELFEDLYIGQWSPEQALWLSTIREEIDAEIEKAIDFCGCIQRNEEGTYFVDCDCENPQARMYAKDARDMANVLARLSKRLCGD